jgi:hypothetical protein
MTYDRRGKPHHPCCVQQQGRWSKHYLHARLIYAYPRLDYKSLHDHQLHKYPADWLVELGYGDKFFFDMGTGCINKIALESNYEWYGIWGACQLGVYTV